MDNGRMLEIEADLANLERAREFVRRAALDYGLEGARVAEVELAVDEAITNIIVHGYAHRDGTVRLQVTREGETVAVILRDDAGPFDVREAPRPDLSLPLAQRPVGGLGVHLIEQSVDEIRYRRSAQGVNELTLLKKLRT